MKEWNQIPAGEAGEIDLRDYWVVIRKRRWVIVSFLAVVLTVGTVLSLVIPRTYRATATLLIEKERNILSFEDVFSIDSSQDAYYQTQYKLLQSRSLASNVITKLSLDKTSEFGYEPEKEEKKNKEANERRTIEVLNNFANRVEVEPVRQTRIVKVSFNAHEPNLAAKIVNTLADEFIETNIQSKFEATEQASVFLSEQIDSLSNEITQKERQLQDYTTKKSIVTLNDKETTVVERLGDLNKALTEAQIERVRKESTYKQISSATADALQDVAGNEVFKRLKEEYARLDREYRRKSEIFKPEYPEMIALRAELDNAKRAVEKEVRNTANSAYADYQVALKKEQSLESMFNGMKTEAGQLNSDAIQYNSLKVEIDNKKQLMESLLTRQSETGISARLKGLRTSNIRIVDRAEVPLTPASPRVKLNILLSLLLGLLGGIGLAFLYEHLDDSVKDSDQINKLLSLPTLGLIPSLSSATQNGYHYGYYSRRHSRSQKVAGKGDGKVAEIASIELIVAKAPQSNISEAYRSIRTALLMSSVDQPRRAFLVTSALPSEGKTTTVVNIAVSLTQADKKVLVIDLDLRKPRLHRIFQFKNVNGLPTYLTANDGVSDRTLNLVNLIKTTPIPGLSVINSGPIPPNPAELLHSNKLTELLNILRHQFDYLLIDAPPLLAVTDALIVAPRTDGLILVVWGGKTTRDALKRVREKMDLLKASSVGVVINNINIREHDYYYKHHYYYYYQHDKEGKSS